MKNKFFITLFLIGCSLFATAQNYSLRIHHFGDVTNQWNTSSISSITLNQGVATFSVNGSDMAKAFSEIDSITFYRNGTTPTTYYTVTVTANPNNGGSVNGGGSFPSGSTTVISATANTGYHFIQWNDGNTETTRTITVTGNVTYTAYFEADVYYTVQAISSNTTMGTTSGTGLYLEGSTATISASANTGYHFTQWSDGNTSSTRSFTVTENVVYTAYFEANGSTETYYTLTVVPNNSTMGAAHGGGQYLAGSTATITAVANTGYHFTQWNDGNTSSERTVTVTGDATYTAYFEADQYYTLTVVSDDESMGLVYGGGSFLANTTTPISATARNGFHFVRWNDNNTDETRQVTVVSDITYTAYFAVDDSGGQDTSATQDTTTVDPESGIHITWNNGSTPTIINGYRDQGLSIEAVGEKVTVNAATGIDDLTYVLDGTSVDGNLVINTDKSLILYMDGLHLHCASGPAIRVVDDHRVSLHLASGSSNCVSDTTNITATEHKAALQSQGKLEIQGDGSLTVKGYTKHAFQSSGKTIMMNGTVNIVNQSATGDGMNVDDFVMQDGSLTVNSLGDGIDGDQGYISITGGTINITCTSAGVKGLGCDSTITISGGNVTINMSGADSKGISGNSNIYISDGTIDVTVSGNQSKGIKADGNLSITGGSTTVKANGTYVTDATGISYCSGMKSDGNTVISGGTVNITCSSANAGGKCISADGNVTINAGTVTLSALGGSGTYTLNSTTKSYTTVGIKSNANVTVNGGTVTMTVGGKGISADTNYVQTGGEVNITTSTNGAVTTGSGTSATDGFCSAGVSTDGNVYITAGTISCVSTGKGGRGFKVDGTFDVGVVGANDDMTHVYVKTSGAAVNTSSGGGFGPGGGGSSSDYWKGLPKGIKVTGSIHINSGHVNSFCAQTSGDPTGEAIESKDSIIINGGYVEANAYDDAINASNYIQINDGFVWAYARGNDAIDCNGAENNSSGGGGMPGGGTSSTIITIEINGGTIIASGTEVAVDDCGDRGGYIKAQNCTMVLIGGSMGVTEATPQLTGQKAITISSSGGGNPWGGGGSSGGLTTAQNGFIVKNSSGNEIMTFKWPTISTGQSGFEDTTAGAKPGNSSGIYITTPDVQTGSYTYWTSPTISGGTSWHGLYDLGSATVTTSGNGSSATAQ